MEMGAKAVAAKPKVDPWSRSKQANRFNGPNSMNPQVYNAERQAKSPAPKRSVTPQRSVTPAAAKRGASETTTPKRAASVPKARPAAEPSAATAAAAPSTPAPHSVGRSKSPSARGSPPDRPFGLDSQTGKGAASAFAPSSKSRFDSGPGSFYTSGSANTSLGPGSFNPNDGPDSFGASSKSGVAAKPKPSAGMAPTAKGRFDGGPGSMYKPPSPRKPKKRATPQKTEEDAAAEEWSKKLGLGAVAGAKAAPVLKAVDEARAQAERLAAEAVAAREAAETRAAEAERKAGWMTEKAASRVAAAEEARVEAESAVARERALHQATASELEQLREAMATVQAEADELRRELSTMPRKKAASPGAGKVIDRRPVRLRGQVDAEKESQRERMEERKAKREEYWKRLESERIAKEEKIRQEALAKSRTEMGAVRGAPKSDRKGGVQPPPATDALKALALVLPAPGAGGSAKDSARRSPSARQASHGESPPRSAKGARSGRDEAEAGGRSGASPPLQNPLGNPLARSRASATRAVPKATPTGQLRPEEASPAAAEEESWAEEETWAEEHAEEHADDVYDGDGAPAEAAYDDAEYDAMNTMEYESDAEMYEEAGSSAQLASPSPMRQTRPPPPPSALPSTSLSACGADGLANHHHANSATHERPTGMGSSHASSPSAAGSGPTSVSNDDSPLALGFSSRAGLPAPAAYDESEYGAADGSYEAAEAQAERMAREEERKAAEAAEDASLDMRLGSQRRQPSVHKGKALEHDGDMEPESAYDAARAAVQAVVGQRRLFNKGGAAGGPGSALSGLKSLSDSMGSLPQDAFLSKLAKAEELPTSPGGYKLSGMPIPKRPSRVPGGDAPSPALFARGVEAM